MPSLRDFLDKSGSDAFTNAPQPAYLNEAKQTDYFISRCQDSCNTDYDKTCYCYWCTPAGTASVTFEAFGGGGGGAGACNCAWGWSGGAGAYAKKQLDFSVDDYSQTKYLIYVAPTTCCSPTSSCGFIGNTSYIAGSGLTNFCAEGGLPGCTLCCMNGCFPIASECGVYPHPSYDDCACYFGADEGIPGRLGFLNANDRNDGDWCSYQQIIPGPGGLAGSTYPVYASVGFSSNTSHLSDRCRYGAQFEGMVNGGHSNIRPVGTGGASARVCVGGCCCGAPGGPGLVKISWTT